MSLKETLSALDDLVPEVPKQIGEVVEDSGRFKEQVEQVLEDVAQTRTQARELVQTLVEALSAVEGQAREHRDQQEPVVVETLASVDTLAKAALEGRDQVQAAIARAGGAMESLEGELVSAGESAGRAEDDASAEAAELAEATRTGSEGLSGAFDSALGAAEGLVEAATSVQDRVRQKADALENAMSELLGQGKARIEQLLATLEGLKADHSDALAIATDHIEARRGDTVEKVRERLDEDLQQRLGVVVDTVSQTLDVLGQALHAAAGKTAEVREVVEAGLALVEEAMEPLPGGIEQVKQAARQVGLDFA